MDKNTLNWEVFLPAMAFAYNTSEHRSIETTPFFLTFGLDHRTPHFKSTPNYGENWDTELANRMKLAWQIAHEHLAKSGQKVKDDHDKKATRHEYQEGDMFKKNS